MLESSGRRDGVVLPSRPAPPRSRRRDRGYRPTGPACPPSATREGPPGASDAAITFGPLLDLGDAARACSDVIEELPPDDIGIETGVRLAAAFHRKPALKVVLMPVTRP